MGWYTYQGSVGIAIREDDVAREAGRVIKLNQALIDIADEFKDIGVMVMGVDADVIEYAVRNWHEDDSITCGLHEYLGLTMEEYAHWVERPMP